jgi:hypothetical protein
MYDMAQRGEHMLRAPKNLGAEAHQQAEREQARDLRDKIQLAAVSQRSHSRWSES